jgi:hypothetical protein
MQDYKMQLYSRRPHEMAIETKDVSTSTEHSTSAEDFAKFAEKRADKTTPDAVSPLIPADDKISKPVDETKKVTDETEVKVKVKTEKDLVKTDPVTEDDDTDTDTDTDDTEQDVKIEKRKKIKSSFKKRVEQLQNEREEARNEAKALREQLEQNEKESPQTQQVNYAEGFAQEKPQQFQFSTISDFNEAMFDWKLAQRDFAQQNFQKQQQAQAETKKRADTWDSRETTAKADLEDYDAIVNMDEIKKVNLFEASHTASREFLIESEHGPVVLYNLFENAELAKSFKEASPIQQVKILSKLEAAVETAQTARGIKTVKNKVDLPAPPKKHASPGMRAAEKTLAEATDFAEFAKIYKAQGHNKGY